MSYANSIENYILGEDFEIYINRLQQFFVLSDIKDDIKKIAALTTLGGGELYKVIVSLIAPKKEKDYKYEELIELLQIHFAPKKNIIAESYKFYKRDQLQSESIAEYIIELKTLAKECDFGDFLERALRDRFVCGVHSEKIQQRLLNETDLKEFKKACEIAQMMETTESNVKEMNSGEINYIGRTERNKKQLSRGDTNENGTNNNSNERTESRGGQQRGGYYGSRNFRRNNVRCNGCGRMGHILRFCRYNQQSESNKQPESEKNKQNLNYLDNEEDTCDFNFQYLNLFSSKKVDGPLMKTVHINGVEIKMEIDTGAYRSVIQLELFKQKFPHVKMETSSQRATVITGESVTLAGVVSVKVEHEDNLFDLELAVVDTNNNFVTLMGRNWLDVFWPKWRTSFDKLTDNELNGFNELNTLNVEKYKKEMFAKYRNVFSDNFFEPIKDFEAEIILKPDTPPIFCKAYPVPFGIRPVVEKELDKLVKFGILKPIKHSKFASPIVIVKKPNGSIRICVDCKRSINRYIETEHYPLPIIDDILADLTGCTVFCVLDLAGAYQQLALSERSQEYLTVNTHKGLFRFTRLVFGVASAPAIFQAKMDEILKDLDKVKCYFDDILIGGTNIDECMRNLNEVLQRFEKYNVRVNKSKCKILQKQIEYVGHVVSDGKIKPNPKKLEAVLNAPKPKNIGQLQSYLGLANYYSKFVPNLSSELCHLYKLLSKNTKFVWSNECDVAFERSKELLLSDNVLALYDPSKETILSCDASPYGVGCVLSQIFDGIEKPILFVSSTLSPAESNYSQSHREAIAIVFGVKKLHKYLYGRPFTIRTDHQNLREIFGDKKTPPVAAARLQRWAIFLSMYQYKIEYKKAALMRNADALSRLPLNESTEIEGSCINNFRISQELPISLETVRKETAKDTILTLLLKFTMFGWPEKCDSNINHYFIKRNCIACENECLFYGERLLIPYVLRKEVLELLHDTHIGISRMKQLARTYVWWPGIDVDIENWCKCCKACQSTQNKKSEAELVQWPTAQIPFERIHIDFFYFEGKSFLIVVDAYSKWLDVFIMNTTIAKSTIEKLMYLFSTVGLPHEIVSDNGPPFNSVELSRFCESLGIKHTRSPPYHPQSNGQGEVAVRVAKCALKKMLIDEKSKNVPIQIKVLNFLLKYRTTPTTVTGQTPASLLFNYKPRTLLDVMAGKQVRVNDRSVGAGDNSDNTTNSHHDVAKNNNVLKEKINNSKNCIQTGLKPIQFSIDEVVSYQNVHDNYIKWIAAKIVKKISDRIYIVDVGGNHKKAHIRQLRKSKATNLRFWPGSFQLKHSNTHMEQNNDIEQTVINDRITFKFPNRPKNVNIEDLRRESVGKRHMESSSEDSDEEQIKYRRSSRIRKLRIIDYKE